MNRIALLVSALLLLGGVYVVTNAEKIQNISLAYRERNQRLYSAMLYGQWLADRPRLHRMLILVGGLCLIGMAAVLLAILWLQWQGILPTA